LLRAPPRSPPRRDHRPAPSPPHTITAPPRSPPRPANDTPTNTSPQRQQAGPTANPAPRTTHPQTPAPSASKRVRPPTPPRLAMARAASHTSLRQRRYALQPRVAAQRLPWDNESIKQFNPERVASFTIKRAATPHRPAPIITATRPLPYPITAAPRSPPRPAHDTPTNTSPERQQAGPTANPAASRHGARRESYLPTPTALRPPAQGCRAAATLGLTNQSKNSTLKGLRHVPSSAPQPLTAPPRSPPRA